MKNGNKLMLMLVMFLISIGMFAQQGNVNFTGSWKLDEAKSELGQGGQGRMRMGGATALNIKQDGNNLSVDRTSTRQDGSANTTSDKYTLDGKPSKNEGMMNRQTETMVSWAGRTLNFQSTQTFEREGQSMEMKSSEVWTLTNPNTLTIVATTNTQQGEMKRTLVYTK